MYKLPIPTLKKKEAYDQDQLVLHAIMAIVKSYLEEAREILEETTEDRQLKHILNWWENVWPNRHEFTVEGLPRKKDPLLSIVADNEWEAKEKEMLKRVIDLKDKLWV